MYRRKYTKHRVSVILYCRTRTVREHKTHTVYAKPYRRYTAISEQTYYFAVGSNVYFFRRRDFGKSGHSHNIAGKHYDKSRARRYFYVFNGDFESRRRAELCHIVRKRLVRFGDTSGEIAEAEFGKTVYLLFRRRKHGYAVAAVNLFNNGFYLFFYT